MATVETHLFFNRRNQMMTKVPKFLMEIFQKCFYLVGEFEREFSFFFNFKLAVVASL